MMEILTFNNLGYYVKKNIVGAVLNAIPDRPKDKADAF